MNAAATVLAQARAAGIVLEARDDRLAYDAPAGAVTPELKASLEQHKAQILKLLVSPAEPAPPWSDHQAELTDTKLPCPAGSLPPWVDQHDVIAVVQDLADEGMRPRRISRELGLTRGEVVTILRRSGR